MSEEQAIYGLIVTAQEQQKIAGDQLATLGELKTTIRQAGEAVQAMRLAGDASVAVIEKATQKAVEQALQGVFERVSAQAKAALADAVSPAVNALQGVTGRAVGVEKDLRESARWFGWKWATVCMLIACGLLATIMGASMLLVPSPKEIAELQAAVAALEAKGGKVQLSRCGPSNRLCARVDAKEKGTVWESSNNKNEKWIILNGY